MSHEGLAQNSGIQTTPRESAGFGDLSHDLAVKQYKSDIIKIGGIGGATAVGIFLASSIRSVDAQSDGSAVNPCASPSPIVSESPAPIPSEAPFSISPDSSPIVTVTASPDVIASPFPSGETNAQAVEVNPSANPLPSPKVNPEVVNCNPETSPTPKATLSPEEIDKLVKKYSLKNFIKLKDPKITEKQFLQILKNTNDVTSAYLVENIDPYYTPKVLLKEDIKAYKKFRKNWNMEIAGYNTITNAIALLSFAQGAAKAADAETAKILAERAEAYVRLGKSYIKGTTSSKYDQEIRDIAKDSTSNGILDLY